MRFVNLAELKLLIKRKLAEICTQIDPAVEQAIKKAAVSESNELAKDILRTLCENYEIARLENLPICQDTGTAVFFLEIGEEICLQGGGITALLNDCVREVWAEEAFRLSILRDPLFNRVNTGDNTPAVIHTEFVRGDKLRIIMALKGGGAENMSALRMFNPSAGKAEIIEFIVDTVVRAGGNPCPPIIVGIGIGGDFEMSALMSKKALFRPLGSSHPQKEWADFELEILNALNQTGIGTQGMGGSTTALAVHINIAPCHLASLPVAVNLQCHAHRHGEIEF